MRDVMAAPADVSGPQWAPSWRIGMMLLMRIERWDARRDGPLNEVALRQKLEARGFSVSARTFPGGAVAAAQADSRDRVQAVVSGLLKVTIDGESAILTAGDMVFVPRGAVRRVEVVGLAPVRFFEAIERI
jgi:quercetin dioxygenase-like cupin family protein